MKRVILMCKLYYFLLRQLERSYLQLRQLQIHQNQKWTAGQRVSFLYYQNSLYTSESFCVSIH